MWHPQQLIVCCELLNFVLCPSLYISAEMFYVNQGSVTSEAKWAHAVHRYTTVYYSFYCDHKIFSDCISAAFFLCIDIWCILQNTNMALSKIHGSLQNIRLTVMCSTLYTYYCILQHCQNKIFYYFFRCPRYWSDILNSRIGYSGILKQLHSFLFF